jgi:hypothetical protein
VATFEVNQLFSTGGSRNTRILRCLLGLSRLGRAAAKTAVCHSHLSTENILVEGC